MGSELAASWEYLPKDGPITYQDCAAEDILEEN